MKIYTKTGKTNFWFEEDNYKIISANENYEIGSVFWYDQHDAIMHNVKFNDGFPDSAWSHLKKDPSSKILLFYGDEYFNLFEVKIYAETIKQRELPPEQVYIVCLDDNWVPWTYKQFSKFGVTGINIQSLNFLMKRAIPQDIIPTTKKFSMFSRNYVDWRLQFFCELVNNNLLDYFEYTFNNIMPYGKIVTYTQSQIKEHAEQMGYTINKKLKNWIEGIPYTLENNNVLEKMSQQVYDKISSSDINVVIESHFDPLWNDKHKLGYSWRELSPAFPTEKTYKAIGCNRPFIIVSTPEFLKEFRRLGYKTFHPYIDETYDTIEDQNKRMKAIINEIDRISKLPTDEYSTLIRECEKIAQYNMQVFKQAHRNFKLQPNFIWMDKILKDNWRTPNIAEIRHTLGRI